MAHPLVLYYFTAASEESVEVRIHLMLSLDPKAKIEAELRIKEGSIFGGTFLAQREKRS